MTGEMFCFHFIFVFMEAIIKISVKEFNQEFFLKLQEMFKKFKDGEVTISLRSENELGFSGESSVDYEKRLLNSISTLESGQGISCTLESLETYLKDSK